MSEYRSWIALLRDSIAHILARRSAGVSAENLIEEGLPERFGSLGAKPRFVPSAGWIRLVHAQATGP